MVAFGLFMVLYFFNMSWFVFSIDEMTLILIQKFI